MYCTNPNYSLQHGFTECRKCHACKVNQRKELSDRLQIERRYWRYAYFVSPTYDPEHYPTDGSVDKEELKRYFKRLAKSVGQKITLMGVGEYGDESGRAHYHCAVYSNVPIFRNIIESWSVNGVPLGRISVDQLSNGRCKYIAGYVVKKMLHMEDERLDGRKPEFRITPRRPALGYGLIYELAMLCAKNPHFKAQFVNRTYVPHSIQLNGSWIRLPRYVRDHLKGFFKDEKHQKKQFEYRQAKKERDFAISCSLTQGIKTVLPGIERKFKQFKENFKQYFDEQNRNQEIAYNKRKRRPL